MIISIHDLKTKFYGKGQPFFILKNIKMKGAFLILASFLSMQAQALTCQFSNANEILSLIKEKHPFILQNNARNKILKKEIQFAGQIPNTNFFTDFKRGKDQGGTVGLAEITLTQPILLGGDISSRVGVAEKNYEAGKLYNRSRNEDYIINTVLILNRLRQIYELIPLYVEAREAFNELLKVFKERKTLSPENRVASETLELASNDYNLKISGLSAERIDIEQHLNFQMGQSCKLSMKMLPMKVNLPKDISTGESLSNYSNLLAAEQSFEAAKAQFALEKSIGIPDMGIGPSLEIDSDRGQNIYLIGLVFTMDIPWFNTNQGGKARAVKQIDSAMINLNNVKTEMELDLVAWKRRYSLFRKSLGSITGRKRLEEKHEEIEALFRRGIISTQLVIEAHRQLIEYSSTRFQFELGALKSLWNIYKINGVIKNKNL